MGSRLTFDISGALPDAKASVLGTEAIAQTKAGTADNFFDGTLNFVSDDTIDAITRLDGSFEPDQLVIAAVVMALVTLASRRSPPMPFPIFLSSLSSPFH